MSAASKVFMIVFVMLAVLRLTIKLIVSYFRAFGMVKGLLIILVVVAFYVLPRLLIG